MSRFDDDLDHDFTVIAERVSPSPDAWASIQQRIADREPDQETEIIMLVENTFTTRRWPLVAAAAAVIALVVGAIAFVNRGDGEPVPADLPETEPAPTPDPADANEEDLPEIETAEPAINVELAEAVVDAFYSWDREALDGMLASDGARNTLLYMQGFAEGAGYTIVNRQPCEQATDVVVFCSVTLRKATIEALGIDQDVTDTMSLAFGDDGQVTRASLMSNDPPEQAEAWAQLFDARPQLLDNECAAMFEGGQTPVECGRAVLQGFRDLAAGELFDDVALAEAVVDAFYAWDRDALDALISDDAARDSLLYLQGFAEGAAYVPVDRQPCAAPTEVLVTCSVTLRKGTIDALGIDRTPTDTMNLTFDDGKVTGVTFVSDDGDEHAAAWDALFAASPDLLDNECAAMFEGGETPVECGRAIVDWFRESNTDG